MKKLFLIMVFVLVNKAFAEPIVLALEEPVNNINDFYLFAEKAPEVVPNTVPIEALFPLKSKMQVKKNSQVKLPLNVKGAFFVIGSDDICKRWLVDNSSTLEKLQAIGYLVQADSEHDYEFMSKLYPQGHIFLVNGDALVEKFNLDGYPCFGCK